MKKTSIALAATVLAGSACAQSVQLFGVADAGFRHVSTQGVGSNNLLASGSYSSSRWGLRGAEDLGGGLAASFWLESFLSVDSGAVSPAGFQRRSTLSLSQRSLGELRLGRDYTPTHSNWSRFDPFAYVGIGSVQLLVLGATGNTPVTAAFGNGPNPLQRVSNSVQYLLPANDEGVDGGLMYSFAEGGTAANDQHRVGGGRLGVTRGAFAVSAAYLRTHDNLTTLGAFTDSVLAGEYDFRFVKVSGGLRRLAYAGARQDNWLLAARVPLGAHELKASWNRAGWGGRVGATRIDGNRADQVALGYVYHFSKRTHFYATIARITNAGAARYVVPSAPAGTAGATSSGFETGINHEF